MKLKKKSLQIHQLRKNLEREGTKRKVWYLKLQMPIPSFENEKNVDEIAMIDIQKYKIKQIKYFPIMEG